MHLWTLGDFFFLSQSELNYELRKQKNRMAFPKLFSVQDAVSEDSRFLLRYFSTLNIKCNIYKTNYDAYYQEWPMSMKSLLVKFQSLLEWVFGLTRTMLNGHHRTSVFYTEHIKLSFNLSGIIMVQAIFQITRIWKISSFQYSVIEIFLSCLITVNSKHHLTTSW